MTIDYEKMKAEDLARDVEMTQHRLKAMAVTTTSEDASEEADRAFERASMKEYTKPYVKSSTVNNNNIITTIEPEVVEPPKPKKKAIHTDITYNEFMSWDKNKLYTEQNSSSQYFLMVTRGVMNNPNYIKLFKIRGYSIVYNYLWSNIVRKTMKGDVYKIVDNYYNKNKLAYTCSHRTISKVTGLSRITINKIINVFEHLGIIEIEKAPKILDIGTSEHKKQNIYILGTWKSIKDIGTEVKQIEEKLLINDVFSRPGVS